MPKRKRYSQLIYLSIAAIVATCTAVLLGRRPSTAIDEPELMRRPLLEPVNDPPARAAAEAEDVRPVRRRRQLHHPLLRRCELHRRRRRRVRRPARGGRRRRARRGGRGRGCPEAEPAPEAAPARGALPPSARARGCACTRGGPGARVHARARGGCGGARDLPARVRRRHAGCATGGSSAPAGEAAPAATPTQAAAPKAASPRAGAEGRGEDARGAVQSQWVVKRAQASPAVEPEHDHGHESGATVWLNRALPDPTPAAARLTREFARDLGTAARRNGTELDDRARHPACAGRARLAAGDAVRARPAQQPPAAATAGAARWRSPAGRASPTGRRRSRDYYKAVGLEALVTGLEAAKAAARQASARGQARHDLRRRTRGPARRPDRRARRRAVQYLAERHGSVTVSSLFSGHRKYSRPASSRRTRTGMRSTSPPSAASPSSATRPRRGHGGRRALDPAPAGRAAAAAGDLAARARRPLVPDGRPRRPHPRWLLRSSAWSPGRARRLRAVSRGGAPAPADARPARQARPPPGRGNPPSPCGIDSHLLHALLDRRGLPERERRRAPHRGRRQALARRRPARARRSVLELAAGESERRGLEVGEALVAA